MYAVVCRPGGHQARELLTALLGARRRFYVEPLQARGIGILH